ncbi:6837_t:CDS:2 [Entrophospora sp. SA101]|nr:13220_t:CDS:2 [Entrophospora sp. SA101]CAJ0632081.1 6291_t:CDS:2 [Entrophospora sp. SA101]CAJ0754936.1 8575_t:CDS:2 [Entrophospora sp. SA101]CAJ0763783.1 6837_t:CDS:2 [Entrophospora sp. SA101]CAJ0828238.1 509_t:CDS:2 [Entrophospora sp. SA101]
MSVDSIKLKELEDYRTLTESLREQLERVHKENSLLIDDNNLVRRKITFIKQELTNSHNEYSRLENDLYQSTQETERLKKENAMFLKYKREIEKKLREETQIYEKERLIWHERESELLDQAKALQETINVLAQQSEQSSQKKSDSSPIPYETLSASHYSNARELKNAQRQIKELEHKISELDSVLVKTKQTSTESIELNKNHVRRIQQLENEISQIKYMNNTLMEDNESYQLLLHEKTIKGDFIMNPILQLENFDFDNMKYTDKAEKVTDNIAKDDDKDSQKSRDSPKSEDSSVKNKLINHTDLSAELERAKALTVSLQEFQDEIKTLRDANKSMQLYIQKILNRIMEAKGFEEILSSDWSAGSLGFGGDQDEKYNNDDGKRTERRKNLSGLHFRSISQPPNKTHKIQILTEEPESLPDNYNSNHKELILTKGLSVPKRTQRSKSISDAKHNTLNTSNNSKRFSFLEWVGGNKETSKKDDPYMRQLTLLKEKN